MIPGLSDYPDLAAQFHEQMRRLKAGRGCSRCQQNRLISKFRKMVADRRERDKLRRKS